ncbi:MAG TPA: hypothetical protein VLQ46_05825 [Casimicrobiaceae bacterium]|nr:hypothetical protein [Casimicrobiaceae bacterium]
MNLSAIDWSTAILVGSIALLVTGVAWKVHLSSKKPAPAKPAPATERNGIGQYRPHVYH